MSEKEVSCGCGCCHGHEHHHEHEHGGEEHGAWFFIRLSLAAVLFIAGLFTGIPYFHYAAYALAGYDVLWSALRNIFHGEVFDENFLMAVASLGAIIIGEAAEAPAVMILYQIGEFLQDMAVDRSRHQIEALSDLRSDKATVIREGKRIECSPEEVSVGETIVVAAGERVPLDGVIRTGETFLDTVALTGESVPRSSKAGDSILSGTVNLSGTVEVEVTKTYGNSAVSRILEMVEEAENTKAPAEKFITRFSKIYTPTVCLLALLLAVIPPLVTGSAFSPWVSRALVFLVISCPCALVISVPLGFFAGIGRAAKSGILVKGGNYLEVLSKADTFVFDKTGTLTDGTFSVTSIESAPASSLSSHKLLSLAAAAEADSSHPVANAIRKASDSKTPEATGIQEIAGHGVKCTIDGDAVLVGNSKLLKENGIEIPDFPETPYTYTLVAVNGKCEGRIIISDTIKENAKEALSELKKLGVKKTVMLSGDRRKAAEAVAKEVGVDVCEAELLPEDKLEKLTALSGTRAYVGDGINDAPVLRAADVGLSMGKLGSDAAIEASDISLMSDDLLMLPKAVSISRKTLRIVKENIVFALGCKILFLILGAFGIAGMWLAIFADVGVALIAIANSLRAMR